MHLKCITVTYIPHTCLPIADISYFDTIIISFVTMPVSSIKKRLLQATQFIVIKITVELTKSRCYNKYKRGARFFCQP